MPEATERKKHLENVFAPLKIKARFCEAIIGKKITLPDPRYKEKTFRYAHGKKTNYAELGCYFSHIKALQLFLETDDEHALIFEDDIVLDDNFEETLSLALKHKHRFDLLRLSGLHKGTPIKIISLNQKYHLACNYFRQTGAGAYLVNRKAATSLIKHLIPMWLPYDHAFDREWLMGIKSMSIEPLPVKQNVGFETQIDASRAYKLPALQRYITVFPFRAYNEISRFFARSLSIIQQKYLMS